MELDMPIPMPQAMHPVWDIMTLLELDQAMDTPTSTHTPRPMLTHSTRLSIMKDMPMLTMDMDTMIHMDMEDIMDMDMIMDMVDLTQSQQELNTPTRVVSVMTHISNTHLPTTTITLHLTVTQSMVMVMVMVIIKLADVIYSIYFYNKTTVPIRKMKYICTYLC